MKVGIVGAGMVGSAAGYALAISGVAQDIVLVDQNPALARAQAEDISHGVPFYSSSDVTSGTYAALEHARVIIVAAGVSQKPGETRLELLGRNATVFRDVIDRCLAHAPDAILLIATNPVDIMTDITLRLSGLPVERVIGSGTILDTARFRTLLGRHLGISPSSVHGYVLGEHGDSEVLSWSDTRIGSLELADFAAQIGAPVTRSVRERIDRDVREAAYHIIAGKGATWFGIGTGLAQITEAILLDQQRVMTVACRTPDIAGIEQVVLSVPRVVGATGMTATLLPDLDAKETEALAASARMLKDLAAQVTL